MEKSYFERALEKEAEERKNTGKKGAITALVEIYSSDPGKLAEQLCCGGEEVLAMQIEAAKTVLLYTCPRFSLLEAAMGKVDSA